jgi:hypothetical protein
MLLFFPDTIGDPWCDSNGLLYRADGYQQVKADGELCWLRRRVADRHQLAGIGGDERGRLAPVGG